MAPSPLQQRRTHNTLLFQKLLNLRDGASPFTLILDTLEQGGGDVVREFVRRGKVCLSFNPNGFLHIVSLISLFTDFLTLDEPQSLRYKSLSKSYVPRSDCLQISKTQVIFISFATLRMKVPFEINAFVSARGKGLAALRDEILSKLPPPTAPTNPSVKQNGASKSPSDSQYIVIHR